MGLAKEGMDIMERKDVEMSIEGRITKCMRQQTREVGIVGLGVGFSYLNKKVLCS